MAEELHDGFGRGITYLRIAVTDKCNFRCVYCMPEEGVPARAHDELLSAEEIARSVRIAAAEGVRRVRLTGGEPLVSHRIVPLIRDIRAIPQIEDISLTTNGALLETLAQPLRQAGVDRLNISLDTLRPDRFRAITRLGELAEVQRGIRAAEAAGFSRLKLNCVLMGGVNDDEVADFAALTRARPWQVRFIELMPMGPCAGWERDCFVPVTRVLERCPELRPERSEGVASCWRLPGAAGTVGLITPMSHAFCGGCDRIRISADGRLKPCLRSDEEISLRGLKGTDLTEAVQQGISRKPMGHHLQTGSDTGRDMNEIGG